MLDERVRKLIEVDPRQFGFMPGKEHSRCYLHCKTVDGEGNRGKFRVILGFVDLKKACDRVPREVIYWSLRRKGVPEKLIRLIQETYRNRKRQSAQRQTAPESLTSVLGSTRGSVLSPLLFAVIVDELTLELRGEEMWELLFAYDLVVMNTKKKGRD